MTAWRIHHRAETASTNLDARAGTHGDVFTADFQTAGRGRLDHKWLSPPGTNLMMSVVLSVEGLSPEQVSTLPLVAGLAVAEGLSPFVARGLSPSARGLSPLVERGLSPSAGGGALLKWPNDVLVGGRKLAGILCERQGDLVVVGIGVNVGQRDFPSELAGRATSLATLGAGDIPACSSVRDAILSKLGELYSLWRANGFAAVYPQIVAIDCLRGRELSVRQTDDDARPATGVCGGILPDGSLDVGGVRIYAGEAHVLRQAAVSCDMV